MGMNQSTRNNLFMQEAFAHEDETNEQDLHMQGKELPNRAGVDLKAIRQAIARVEAEAKATVAAENRARAEERARALAEDRARADAEAGAEAHRNAKAAEDAIAASRAR